MAATPGTPGAPAMIRHIEQGLSVFSAAELHVAVVPIGRVPPEILLPYYSLITRHRQVELQVLRSFYKEQGKSPFPKLPWKTGSMHFRFLPEEVAMQASLLKELHTYRKVRGVIGICHCPALQDLDQAYQRFEQTCRSYPDAFVMRCFAFQPSDALVQAGHAEMPNLMLFPPTESGLSQLGNHAEVVMLDFAASLLAELEKWMSSASTAMVDLSSYADSDRFIGPASMVVDIQRRLYTDEEMLRKRRYGRLRKAMGDVALLAGSPADANDHYSTAIELSRPAQDFVWCAAALEGKAHAMIVEACVSSGAFKAGTSSAEDSPTRLPGGASQQAGGQGGVARSGSAFGGPAFWGALRDTGVEREARALYLDAKKTLQRVGGLSMQIEQDLKLGRFLAGLWGRRVRVEVSDMMSNMVEAGWLQQYDYDKLMTLTEAAQVLGMVGSTRKRVMHIWHAVETCKAIQFYPLETMQNARKALEPPVDPSGDDGEEELLARRAPLGAGVPKHWGRVRAACLEAVLSIACNTNQHADVWDAAARLLSDHHDEVHPGSQKGLVSYLKQSASNMSPQDRGRLQLGPPPLVGYSRTIPLSPVLTPHHPVLLAPPTSKLTSQPSLGPFIYNPFSKTGQGVAPPNPGELCWVCGEKAGMEIELWNPTSVEWQISRMTLEAVHLPQARPSSAGLRAAVAGQLPGQLPARTVWKPATVAVTLPPWTAPTKVTLSGTPLSPGTLLVLGCRMQWTYTFHEAGQKLGESGPPSIQVTWVQPWAPLPSRRPQAGKGSMQGMQDSIVPTPAQTTVTVVAQLPKVEVRLDAPQTSAQVPGDETLSKPEAGLRDQGGASGGAGKPSEGVQTVAAFKGQILHWRLYCVSSGALPVARAQLAINAGDVHELRPRTISSDKQTKAHHQPRGEGSLQCTADQAVLAQSLPLAPHSRVVVPITVHAPKVASYTSEEEATLDLQLEYAGPEWPADGPAHEPSAAGAPSEPEASEEDASEPAAQQHWARRASAGVRLLLRPSVQVNAISFSEHHVPAPEQAAQRSESAPHAEPSSSDPEPYENGDSSPPGTQASSGDPAQASDNPSGHPSGGWPMGRRLHRHAVLEADVTNRTDLALQVWLGPRQQGDSAEASWAAITDTLRPWSKSSSEGPLNARCKLIQARQRLGLAVMLELGDVGQAPGLFGLGLRWDEAARQACAALICARYAVFWRREDLNDPSVPLEGGVLPLSQSSVTRALSQRTLSTLLPGPVQVTFCAASDPSGHTLTPLQKLIAPGASLGEGSPALGALWGVQAATGQLLHFSLQASNCSSAPVDLQTSLACVPHDALPDAEEERDEASVMFCGATSGIHLELEASGSAQHRTAVCFLTPGLYQLTAHSFEATAAEHSMPGGLSTSVHPLYVAVS